MAQAASKTCQVCVSAPGSHYCIDCEEYYCGNCKLLHHRERLSRNHQFQKASDLIPEGKSKCNEHKEELTLICNTCNAQVCTRCVTGKHNGHTFSQIFDVIVQLQGENETIIRIKTNEANQNMKKIEESLISFDNSVESVIKAIKDESNIIKRLVDKSVAQMIALVTEQSKKEKDKLINMLSEAKSVLVNGHTLDRKRKELDKTRQDGSLVQKISNLKEEMIKLKINSLPKFPKISFNRKSIAEDDIRQLIGTYSISKCAPVLEKKDQYQRHLYRCDECGREEIRQSLKRCPLMTGVPQYSTYTVKSSHKTRRGTKAGRNCFRPIRTIVTSNQSVFNKGGKINSNLIYLTPSSAENCANKFVGSPITTLVTPRICVKAKLNQTSSNLRKIPRTIYSYSFNKLSLISLNVRSVKNRSTSICDFMQSNNAYLLALTETWLGSAIEKSVISEITPDGYHVKLVWYRYHDN
ncbi:Hypothetical predicted protein [Mytilus galloprovincialis]|uniref:B box-type domain-containing protein n=1 Tax=Mytilus galloprovincialis TaxID=29158 RepID=A0A8B6HBV1_MYTGA|nr:Hypothetical predicted protein [Mytilus galloprovincialis]